MRLVGDEIVGSVLISAGCNSSASSDQRYLMLLVTIGAEKPNKIKTFCLREVRLYVRRAGHIPGVDTG
jgi:hypothetical protein